MLFAIYCQDAPHQESVRKQNRPAHLEYIQSLGERLLLAGPLLSDDGSSMQGSLLVVDVADRAAAEAFAAHDPYAKANLFRSVAIHRFKQVLP